ncbi:GNAT family N-acetyltransferase [Xanthobacter pseudotagetidis]|uniref:GNAT family N-acetyltransferase n=1 Tax=Xanthobacter pseudotagetidis TaxID=3119911 RepID=UPI00372A2E8B
MVYEVRHEERAGRGRYFIELGRGAVAEMEYRRGTDGRMIITHTGVPPAFEGQGIAAQLVDAAVAAARAEGWKITPLCSYVAARFRRHPEWHDLLA